MYFDVEDDDGIEQAALSCYFAHTQHAAAKSLQSCPTLCDPIDGSPPGSPVPGILQARTLEWGAIAFSDTQHIWGQIFNLIIDLKISL